MRVEIEKRAREEGKIEIKARGLAKGREDEIQKYYNGNKFGAV